MTVEQLLRSMSSAELSEWMAYFTMSAEESRPDAPTQSASGEAALDLLRKHAVKR